jgi:hypothetical protein
MIKQEDLPRCRTCTSPAVAITLRYEATKEHERPLDGLRVVDELRITGAAYRCPNYHYWSEVLAA